MNSAEAYRSLIPQPPGVKIAGPSARTHAQERLKDGRASSLFENWARLYAEPYRGLTADGRVRRGLYELRPEGAPTAIMVDAAKRLQSLLTPEQRRQTRFLVDAPEWRRWQNTELYVEKDGLRLEEANDAVRNALLGLMRASLSETGYDRSINAMRLNRFLGDLVDGPAIMNEWSFTFSLFGEPSLTEPWGWQCFGHHLCLNCFVLAEQMVLSPAFWGAEPRYADSGPYAGTRLFDDEELEGLQFMRMLSLDQRKAATIAHSIVGGDLPPGRRHFADNLHLGGAFQDNRVVPYEGLRADTLSATQRHALLELLRLFLSALPEGPLTSRLAEAERHFDSTYFCWIGGIADDSPFYFRIQSPVAFVEFDHHSGVFLTNSEPAKFHAHMIVRTPNGNDYGHDLLCLHRDR
ncbi:MAG TPA: DUF3500 domain-containing protein [Bradyrhizobium sp.]|nr:DUF3500 domain-containing protein [Bradyrhizobium sp.]